MCINKFNILGIKKQATITLDFIGACSLDRCLVCSNKVTSYTTFNKMPPASSFLVIYTELKIRQIVNSHLQILTLTLGVLKLRTFYYTILTEIVCFAVVN